MRLFTGIALSSEVTERLETLVRRLKPTARIKWSRVANLHITTKFIGEWPEESLDEVKDVLRSLPRLGPIPIAVRGLGWFPNERAPRVFWAGIEAENGLRALAQETEESLAKIGIPVEKRKFSPHLTLARIKGPANLGPLHREIEGLPSDEFGSFTAESLRLYLSQLQPTGSVYTSLEEYPLGES